MTTDSVKWKNFYSYKEFRETIEILVRDQKTTRNPDSRPDLNVYISSISTLGEVTFTFTENVYPYFGNLADINETLIDFSLEPAYRDIDDF